MSLNEPSGPDLAGVIADANSAGLEHVVIGGLLTDGGDEIVQPTPAALRAYSLLAA
jgi:hypothetical protein